MREPALPFPTEVTGVKACVLSGNKLLYFYSLEVFMMSFFFRTNYHRVFFSFWNDSTQRFRSNMHHDWYQKCIAVLFIQKQLVQLIGRNQSIPIANLMVNRREGNCLGICRWSTCLKVIELTEAWVQCQPARVNSRKWQCSHRQTNSGRINLQSTNGLCFISIRPHSL